MSTPQVSGAEADPESLRQLMVKFRELPPKIRTRYRRELRPLGDDTIGEQKAILDGPLPKGVAVTGRVLRPSKNRKTGKWGVRSRNVYGDVDVKRPGRSSGLRDGIKAGLKLRIVMGKTRQGLEIKTTGPKVDGFNKAKFWNKRRFRHPVFGNRQAHVDQAGQPYFREPVYRHRDEMVRRARSILSDATSEV